MVATRRSSQIREAPAPRQRKERKCRDVSDMAEVGQVGHARGGKAMSVRRRSLRRQGDNTEAKGSTSAGAKKIRKKSFEEGTTLQEPEQPKTHPVPPDASLFPTIAQSLHGVASDRVNFYGLVQELITPDGGSSYTRSNALLLE